ncbi:MAG: DNA starvation/stationary phase protection protein Dps [Chloroflexi bacterium]|nr:DNA starvation/stationary phase protection protein Dps [Chloroflexota bacterium]
MATKAPALTVVDTLNARLADLVDLHWQVKQAHWNVTGLNFQSVHELFDAQAALVRGMADTIAERVRALKAPADGTARLAAERSILPEFPHTEIAANAAIKELVSRYEQISAEFAKASDVAADADDKATEDLFIGFVQDIDLQAYFLRSHLQ